MRWHDEVRQQALRWSFRRYRCQLVHDVIGAKIDQQLQLRCARRFGPLIREIDDLALRWTIDGAVRLVYEADQLLRVPMVAACLSFVAVHALLHDRPLAVVGHEEAVQIEVETVLHGSTVDLGNQPAGARQVRCVKTDALAQ